MNRFLPLALIVPALACASAQARTAVDVPTLEVPPVPPRVIGPPAVAEPPAVEPVVEPPAVTPPPAARPRPPRDTRAEPRPEPKPETPPEGTAATPAPAPVGPLRVNGTADGPEAERQVKEILERAGKLLVGVDTRSLSEGRQADLEAARNFIKQAEDNVKAANLVLARSLAERAETLAKLLSGRH